MVAEKAATEDLGKFFDGQFSHNGGARQWSQAMEPNIGTGQWSQTLELDNGARQWSWTVEPDSGNGQWSCTTGRPESTSYVSMK